MDVGLLSFVLAALKLSWDLTPAQMGWLGSINSIGMAVGALVFGIWADKVGRRRVFIATLLWSGVIYAEGGAKTVWSDYRAKRAAPLPDWLRAIVSP